jgi:hypothetical protein
MSEHSTKEVTQKLAQEGRASWDSLKLGILSFLVPTNNVKIIRYIVFDFSVFLATTQRCYPTWRNFAACYNFRELPGPSTGLLVSRSFLWVKRKSKFDVQVTKRGEDLLRRLSSVDLEDKRTMLALILSFLGRVCLASSIHRH